MISAQVRGSSDSATVLVVADDPGQRHAHADVFEQRGCRVRTAATGREAVALLEEGPFDCVVSALAPGGAEAGHLLQHIRARDENLPVVVVTQRPTLQAALEAIEWGVFRFLALPVEVEDLVRAVGLAARMRQIARLRSAANAYLQRTGLRAGSPPELGVRFEAALAQLRLAFQPIVRWPEPGVVGFEALVRSGEPLLADPSSLLDVAERLGRVHDLGRAIRMAVAEAVRAAPGHVEFFVNLHPLDLVDPTLYSEAAPLSAVASRIVLEITERASLAQIDHVHDRTDRLRRLGYRIAMDDLGAGYSDLRSFALLEPEVVKLDITLTHDIHLEPRRHALVECVAAVCRDMHVSMIAEGVESRAERDALAAAGCRLFQGFLFGRPDSRLTAV